MALQRQSQRTGERVSLEEYPRMPTEIVEDPAAREALDRWWFDLQTVLKRQFKTVGDELKRLETEINAP